MTLLGFLITVASVVFFLFGVDLYKRKKATILHFLVFVGGSIFLLMFNFNLDLLDSFGSFFGVARGADVIVYVGIIVLAYLYIGLYNKQLKHHIEHTKLIRSIALKNAEGSLQGTNTAVVIPARNEPDDAIPVIDNVLKKGYGVVFIDDGSSNNLYDKIKQKLSCDRLIMLQHINNLGQGAALRTGFEYIKRNHMYKDSPIEYIATYDSDGQQDINELKIFFDAFKQDPSLDIVLGSRFIKKSKEYIPFLRKIILKGGVIFTGIVSGLWLTDSQNGYRLIHKKALSKIHITLNGMGHASEILDQIHSKKLRYKEVPVTVKYNGIRPSLVQSNGNAIKIASKIIYKKLFFR